MSVLVSGAAGFIGFHCASQLVDRGRSVVGIDNLNDYYDVSLKQSRLANLFGRKGFTFEKIDIADRQAVAEFFARHSIRDVVHLAAQPGVRYSLENPHAYIDANLVGFSHILEGCRAAQVRHLVFASSSSVYGANRKMPFAIQDNVDRPVSLYAATKKANELMAHAYSHLFQIPTTGLRLFTVYGPWGRPDMALFLFTRNILEGRPIDVFNYGKLRRDFTYVDDIVEGIIRVLDRPPQTTAAALPGELREPPYKLYNIGTDRPVELLHLIEVLEKCLGRTTEHRLLPMQPGDLHATWADVDDLRRDVGFSPSTPIEIGVARFVDWYRSYYKI